MKLLLALAISLLFEKTSAQWKDTGIVDAASNSYYFNPLYIYRVNEDNRVNIIKAWIKSSAKDFTARDGTKYDNIEIKVLWLFDCNRVQCRVIKTVFYKPSTEIIETNEDVSVWYDPVPESIANALLKKLCSRTK